MWKEACCFGDEQHGISFSTAFSLTPHDKRWFCDTHLLGGAGGQGIERGASDSVWDLAGPMRLSRDPLSIIAAIPTLRTRYWSDVTRNVPTETEGETAEHLILGKSQRERLNDFVCGSLRTGVATAASNTTQLVVVTDAGADLDDEMAFVLIRSLHASQQVELKGASRWSGTFFK